MVRKKRPQQLRIIGGDWRGRKLPFPEVDGLRPTMDRVRETLFNWLMFDVQGARVADIFAGSGALGLEALSRGAQSALFIERDRGASQQIEQNLRTLGVTTGQAEVLSRDFFSMPSVSESDAFDLVFLDPPFDMMLLPQICKRLHDDGWLKKNALVYLEWRARHGVPETPESWANIKQGKAGDSAYGLFRKT